MDPARGLAEGRGPASAGAARGWTAAETAGARDPAAALEALFALQPRRWLRRIPGRETFVAGDELAAWGLAGAVLKRFAGDPAGDRWFARLRRVDPRSPARREAENLAALAGLGLAVPRPLAWFEEPGASGRSALAMEAVPHERTLVEVLAAADAAGRRAWLERAAELVARLHAAGWYHRDLYGEHWIVPADAARRAAVGLVLLDVGRARCERRPRARWFVKDLAALEHSAPPQVAPRERLRFLARYLAARGFAGELSRRDRRALARAVRRKAARMARHAPRFSDPHSARSLPAR